MPRNYRMIWRRLLVGAVATLALSAAFAWPAPASAQPQEPSAKQAPAAGMPAPVERAKLAPDPVNARAPVEAPLPAADSAGSKDSYHSMQRGMCMEELRKDKQWRVELEKQLRIKMHRQESELIAMNEKHVIMAYSALWIIVVIFVAAGWRKQRGMREEIERLQQEVERMADA